MTTNRRTLETRIVLQVPTDMNTMEMVSKATQDFMKKALTVEGFEHHQSPRPCSQQGPSLTAVPQTRKGGIRGGSFGFEYSI